MGSKQRREARERSIQAKTRTPGGLKDEIKRLELEYNRAKDGLKYFKEVLLPDHLLAIFKAIGKEESGKLATEIYWDFRGYATIVRTAYYNAGYDGDIPTVGQESICSICKKVITFKSIVNKNNFDNNSHICYICQYIFDELGYSNYPNCQRDVWKYEGGKYGLEEDVKSIHNLRTMPYQEYLQSDHWAAKRKEALDFYGHRCVVCHTTAQLQVHHRTYAHKGLENMNDLVVLCSECHKLYHNKYVVKTIYDNKHE